MEKIKQNVVLINLNYYDNPIKRKVNLLFLPNLGIDSIYTHLNCKYPKLNLHVIDSALNNFDNNQTKEEILNLDPEIVGFSTSYVNIKDALSISKELKKENPSIITVLGGPGAKSLIVLRKKQDTKSLDYCIVGDGEKAFEEVIKNGKNQLRTVYIKNTITDLDSLEFPKRECFDTEKYIKINKEMIKRGRMLNIYTSKGCDWGKCVYCTVNEQYRTRNPHKIKEEIKYLLEKFSITELLIVDDNFFSEKYINKIYQITNVLGAYPGLKWIIETRFADFSKDIYLSKKVLERMKQNGCAEIAWGMESGDDKILKNLRKGVNTKDIETVLRLTTEAGIPSELFIMYNSPGESKKSLDTTLSFLRRIFHKYNIVLMRVSEYVNIPGSIGWKLGLRKGGIPSNYIKVFEEELTQICSENNIIVNYFKYE